MIGWVEIADADSYLADKFGADAWASLSTQIKTQALKTSYRKLIADTRFSFPDPSQDPQEEAQIEFAWVVYQNSGLPKIMEAQSKNLKSFSIGNFSETYKDDGRIATKNGNFGYGAIVDDLIRQYFVSPVLFGTISRSRSRAEGSNIEIIERIPELYDN